VDYRGVKVLADIRAVPGTSWFAVAKMDEEEAMAPWRTSFLEIGGLMAGLAAGLSTLFFSILRIRGQAHSELLLESAAAGSATLARLAAIVDGSQNAIIATDIDGVVTAWNEGAERLLGHSALEMIGQPMVAPMGRLPKRGLHSNSENVIERIRRGEAIEDQEERHLTKNGRIVDLSISISPIRDGTGCIVGSSRIARDITEQKRVGRELDRLRWMLSPPAEIVPGASDDFCAVLPADSDHVVLDAVGATLLADIAAGFQSLMGTCFSMHEANGASAYSVIVADWCRFIHIACSQSGIANGGCRHQGCGADAGSRAMANGKPVEAECTGGMRLYTVPIQAGGEVVGALSMGYGEPPSELPQLVDLASQIGVDVVELEKRSASYEVRPPFIVALAKQRLVGSAHLLGEIVQRRRGELAVRDAKEKLERSNRDLEQFAYIASHDLQEPLRMVASYTQLLAQRYGEKLDQDARDFINYAVDGATRMKQLIEDLLSYSRVTSKGRPAAAVDTRNSVAQAVRNLELAISETQAEIVCGNLPTVRADAVQVAQIFQNLFGNAVKFHTPGVPPRICVDAHRSPDYPRCWLFRVTDNGIGIEPKFFDRVFAIFQRLHTRREYPGTGIGLAVCQKIVDRHGGRIWIESEPGKGTRILFTLPEETPEKDDL
jgi:PAS domain S-box-containing protein